jgi:hypothetical protein
MPIGDNYAALPDVSFADEANEEIAAAEGIRRSGADLGWILPRRCCSYERATRCW